MKRVQIPGTDCWVAPFAFGTAGITRQNAPRMLALIEHYLAAGGNLIDTAFSYGRTQPGDPNTTEQLLGSFLRQRQGSCDACVYIASKGGSLLPASPDKPDSTCQRAFLSEHQLRCELMQSRKALHRARIDLYYLHRDRPDVPVGQLVDLLEQFISEGLIARYGLSNFTAERVAAALEHCRQRRYKGLVAISNRWSLSRWNPGSATEPGLVAMDDALYELHLRHPLTAMPYSGLGRGYFAKLARDPASVPEPLQRAYGSPLNDRRLEALLTLGSERHVPVSSLALAFLLQQPFPVVPVLSFSTPAQLQEAILATEISLRPAELALLGAGERY